MDPNEINNTGFSAADLRRQAHYGEISGTCKYFLLCSLISLMICEITPLLERAKMAEVRNAT